MSGDSHVAIDLGASSGRALVGSVQDGGVSMSVVHRFQYDPRPHHGHLRWDMARLFEGLGASIARARDAANAEHLRLDSVGVDSWGVDYGYLDAEGRLLDDPVCYRDERTLREVEHVFGRVPRNELFARTGIQSLPFNTLFQLAADVRAGLSENAARLLMIPDLCHHFLCGTQKGERTNASTTQLLAASTGEWDRALAERIGFPAAVLPEIVPAGTEVGRLRGDLCADLGVNSLRIIAPGTHDTASAVAGTPLHLGWAYISSGTWSLVGTERYTPLLSREAQEANFSNEAGVYGTVRLLKNVMGLWLLERCRKEWYAAGHDDDVRALLDAASAVPGFPGFVFPDAARFFNPASMTGELRASLRETGQPDSREPARLAKVVLDSLALRYASVVRTLEGLTGRAVPGLHIVGGGSQNDYLNQATADASGRPVLAGPVEATALGNLIVQAIARGRVSDLASGRRLLAISFPVRRFEPRHTAAWARAAATYAEIEEAASAQASNTNGH
jgi:rhamnulokinase